MFVCSALLHFLFQGPLSLKPNSRNKGTLTIKGLLRNPGLFETVERDVSAFDHDSRLIGSVTKNLYLYNPSKNIF